MNGIGDSTFSELIREAGHFGVGRVAHFFRPDTRSELIHVGIGTVVGRNEAQVLCILSPTWLFINNHEA
jgi:hypothetical protein